MEYTENNYLTKRLGANAVLVTTDHGAWTVLSNSELELLRFHRLAENTELFERLEKEGMILTENNVQSLTESFVKKKYFLFRGPSRHMVSMTSRCNHRCIYCFVGGPGGKDMDADTAKAVADFIFQAQSTCIDVELTGGEPLLNFPVMREMIDYCVELSKKTRKTLFFSLVTNLSAMDDDILKFLIKNNVGISTSLDGPKELHEKNRKFLGEGSSYEKVTYWIGRIREEYKYRIGALPVITKNSLTCGREMVDEYVRQRLPTLRLKYAACVGSAANWSSVGYSADEYVSFWKDTLDYILELNKRGVRLNEGVTTLFGEKILNTLDPNYIDLNMPCGAAIMGMAYTENGDVYTCDEARGKDVFRLGNVRDTTLRETIESTTCRFMADLSSGYSFVCDACVWRPYCGMCLVCSYHQQGSMINKLPLDFRCGAHKKMLEHLFRKLIFSPEDAEIIRNWVIRGAF